MVFLLGRDGMVFLLGCDGVVIFIGLDGMVFLLGRDGMGFFLGCDGVVIFDREQPYHPDRKKKRYYEVDQEQNQKVKGKKIFYNNSLYCFIPAKEDLTKQISKGCSWKSHEILVMYSSEFSVSLKSRL